MHTIKRRRQVVVAELVRAVAVDEEVVGVEEASLIAPTRTSSLIGKLDRPHAYQFIDRVLNGAQAGAQFIDRVLNGAQAGALVLGKLDRQA